MVNDRELATQIASDIFDVFGSPDRCQRLAAKGGKYPDAETDLGGLCETALVDVIERSLHARRSY